MTTQDKKICGPCRDGRHEDCASQNCACSFDRANLVGKKVKKFFGINHGH